MSFFLFIRTSKVVFLSLSRFFSKPRFFGWYKKFKTGLNLIPTY